MSQPIPASALELRSLLRSDGELVVRVATENGEHYEYPVVPRGETQIENARAVLGKGLKGRYFQADLANVEMNRTGQRPRCCCQMKWQPQSFR